MSDQETRLKATSVADNASKQATRWCYIDGCRNAATLIRESYTDDVLLCDEHRDLDDGEWP